MASTMSTAWESDLAGLLDRLSVAQRELLALLATKRDFILRRDHAGLAGLAVREEELAGALRGCLDDRQRLLAKAEAAGLPNDSLLDLAGSFPGQSPERLTAPLSEARRRSQLIRHESLAQWVVFQRSVLHLSQLLEIIATGGRQQPTYGNGRVPEYGGALLDQAV